MSNDVLQVPFFGAVCAVVLLLFWYVFVRAPKSRWNHFRDFAAKWQLTYVPPASLGSIQQGFETAGIDGTFEGVPVALRSSQLVNTSRAGASGHSELFGRAARPIHAAFAVAIEPRGAGPLPDAVLTGDQAFDSFFCLTSDNPGAARALLDPHLRTAVMQTRGEHWRISIEYQGGAIAIRLPHVVWEGKQIPLAFGLLLTACRVALG